MKQIAGILLVAVMALVGGRAEAAEHRLGGGILYWQTVDHLGDEYPGVKDSGGSWALSYQYVPAGVLRYEFDLEYFGDGFDGSKESAFSPVVFVLLGQHFYGGLGLGGTYSDGLSGDFSGPFYAARVGLDMLLLPKTRLDINANYRAQTFQELDRAATDTITFGGYLRFSF